MQEGQESYTKKGKRLWLALMSLPHFTRNERTQKKLLQVIMEGCEWCKRVMQGSDTQWKGKLPKMETNSTSSGRGPTFS
jgi:hypothetical protein